jgi:hypothetical protein
MSAIHWASPISAFRFVFVIESLVMHTAAPGRRIVSLAATVIVLIRIAVCLPAFRPMNVIVEQNSVAGIGLASAMLLLAIGLVWWKGIAALPRLALVPIFLSAGWSSLMLLQPQRIDSSSQQQEEAPSLSVSSRFDGVEVWCNGVRLGEIPLKITLEEFDQKVAPADHPPDQPSTIIYEQQQRPGFSSAQCWPFLGIRTHVDSETIHITRAT